MGSGQRAVGYVIVVAISGRRYCTPMSLDAGKSKRDANLDLISWWSRNEGEKQRSAMQCSTAKNGALDCNDLLEVKNEGGSLRYPVEEKRNDRSQEDSNAHTPLGVSEDEHGRPKVRPPSEITIFHFSAARASGERRSLARVACRAFNKE